jgi:hypothetical protein
MERVWILGGNPIFILMALSIYNMDLVMQSQIPQYGFHYFFSLCGLDLRRFAWPGRGIQG